MRRLRAWASRLVSLFQRSRAERELADEIEAHLAMHAADNERAGMTPAEARRRALIALGGVEAMKEQYRDRRGVPWIETTLRDARYALRAFRRTPGFTAAALVVLALGIGANTAIFTVVNAVLLRPLPYRDPDRLVRVFHVPPPALFPGLTRFSVSAANYLDWEREQHVFERMAVQQYRGFALTGRGDPEQLTAAAVSADFFEVFGVHPVLGRAFARDEDQPGRNHVIILGHALWRGRFGGDPGIVGQSVVLNGLPYNVVGVMGASFRVPGPAQLWTPLGWTEEDRAQRSNHNASVVARLAAGVDLARAQSEMNAISHRLERAYPQDNKGWGAVIVPYREDLVGDLRPSLLVLLGAVAFVLLIACANVANLVLARTVARRRELAVRLALGAGPGRVVRQILTETTLLAAAGASLGLAVANGGVQLIVAFFGDRLPPSMTVDTDTRVLAFTASVALFTGLSAGLAPALRLTRTSAVKAIKEGGGRGDSDEAGARLRGVLVIAEVALSLVLLVGAGLMIRSLWLVDQVNAGFDPRNVLTASVELPETRYDTPERRVRFCDALVRRLRALPEVDSAALVTNLPLVSGNAWPVAVVGRPQVPVSEQPQVQGDVITPGYLTTMRIPLVRGRDFTEDDRAGRPGVVIVSESMAAWLWPGQDPIGQRLTIAFFPDVVREVVGLAKDVKARSVTEPGISTMYLPVAQLAPPGVALVVRTRTSPPDAVSTSVVGAVHELDAEQPVVDVMAMERIVARSTSDRRFTMLLLAAFAALAMVLAAVGIYSVLAYAVRRRMREIGIRMTLGADRRSVVRMVIADGLRPTLVGVGIGFLGALAIRRVMASLVFGVGTADPATLASVTTLLMLVAVSASALPAYWATRVDPVVTLRDE